MEQMDILSNVLLESQADNKEEEKLDPENVLLALNTWISKRPVGRKMTRRRQNTPKRFKQISCQTNKGTDSFLKALTHTVTCHVNGVGENDNSDEEQSNNAI